MHKIKFLLLACIIASMSLALPANAFNDQAVIVYTQDSDTQAFVFSELESVDFANDGSVVINMLSGESVSFPADKFASIRFGEEAAINGISNDISEIHFNHGTITSPYGEILVYNVNGQFAAQGYDQISIDDLPQGVYIVATGGRTLKISVSQ